jgi:replicative DNA helicase
MIAADPDAEKALLAAALLSKQAFLDVTAMIEPEMFFTPAYQHIWAAIEQCSPETNDPVLIAGRLKANGFDGDQYNVQTLVGFYNVPAAVSNAKRYARAIFDNHVRRQLLHGIAETSQAMQTGTLDAMAARDDLLSKLQGISTPDDEHESMTADEFIASINAEYDWLIPGFLERMDRFLLTGGEGSGKSTLLAQLAFMAAAGLHPWVLQPVDPVRVTYVDPGEQQPASGAPPEHDALGGQRLTSQSAVRLGFEADADRTQASRHRPEQGPRPRLAAADGLEEQVGTARHRAHVQDVPRGR